MTTTAKYNLVKLLVFTITMPLAVVLSTHLARSSFEKVKLRGQTIRVKGYAEQPIVSDRAEWTARITTRDADRTNAYSVLSEHRMQVLAFLEQQGYVGDVVVLSPVEIDSIYQRDTRGNRTNAIEYYELSQSFRISDTKVNQIASAAKKSSVLIANGVALESESPSYLYTKLNDMKLAMLEQATINARERALKLVSASSNGLGPLRYASQGVFQITPAFSSEVSDSGYNDTTSMNKVIKAVVTLEYAIQ